MAAGVLIGAEGAKDLRGAAVGTVEDLVLDVRDGRVLYVIVEAQQRYFRLPIRALHERDGAPRFDIQLAGEIAHTDDPRFRRAQDGALPGERAGARAASPRSPAGRATSCPGHEDRDQRSRHVVFPSNDRAGAVKARLSCAPLW